MANQVFLGGRIAKEPETKTTNSGKQVTNIILLEKRWNGHEEVKQSHRLVLWGDGRAEFVRKHLGLGDYINVQGRIEYGSYENSDGHTVYTTDIVVESDIELVTQAERNRNNRNSN